jgi:hypothetical protein
LTNFSEKHHHVAYIDYITKVNREHVMRSLLFGFSRLGTMSKRYFSNTANKEVKKHIYLSPSIHDGAKLVLPISMGRYGISEAKTEEYDEHLYYLFKHTAGLLLSGNISSVDIISTVDLQRINWDDQFADKIEAHFWNTHKEILGKQSNFYTWNKWIDDRGRDKFEANCAIVADRMQTDKTWKNCVIETHQSAAISVDLEKSIEYQKQEYAAIMLMDYDYMVYMGSISSAWAYTYRALSGYHLPQFIQAKVESFRNPILTTNIANADSSEKILMSALENTIMNKSFPQNRKEALIKKCQDIIYIYGSDTAKNFEPSVQNSHMIRKSKLKRTL